MREAGGSVGYEGGRGACEVWSGRSVFVLTIEFTKTRGYVETVDVPLSRLRTPESGAPSASMRRGFLISMVMVGRWGLLKEVAEFVGGLGF